MDKEPLLQDTEDVTSETSRDVIIQYSKSAWAHALKFRAALARRLQSLLSGFILGTKYVWSDFIRSKQNAFIGIFTVLLVLAFVCLMLQIIILSPVLFLKIVENEVGEFDLTMTPMLISSATDNDDTTVTEDSDSFGTTDDSGFSVDSLGGLSTIKLVNETEVRMKLANVPSVIGSTPRWTLIGKLYNADNYTLNGTVAILIIDSAQEEKIGVGRDWNRRPLGYEEAYVSNSALRQVQVPAAMGQRVHVGFDFLGLLTSFSGLDQLAFKDLMTRLVVEAWQNKTVTLTESDILSRFGIDVPIGEDKSITINLGSIPEDTVRRIVSAIVDKYWDTVIEKLSPENLYIECTVVDGIETPNGKWPSVLGNVVVLESKYMLKWLSTKVPKSPMVQDLLAQVLGLKEDGDDTLYSLEQYILNSDINAYAMMAIVQYRDRFETYKKQTAEMDADMIEFSNEVIEALGVAYPVAVQLPIQATLVAVNYLRMFLDQIFNSVLIILVSMGVMLIYSLLLSDVEDKTYEYGMLRALGLQHDSLIQLLLIQAVFYAIPGIIIGLSIAYALSIPAAYFLAKFSSSVPSYTLSPYTILLGVVLGLGMPIISNIMPIKRALSRTLRDSLDVYHQSSQQISVRMIKLESLGLDPWQIATALLMVFIGFMIYYVVPLTFIFLNVSLFLTILNGVLMGMLFGATVVAAVFQPVLERQVLKALLWGKDRTLEVLISKSLAGHRTRNRKTALMYSTCLAFIIFSGAMFTLQASAITDNVRLASGSDLLVASFSRRLMLNEDPMREFLQREVDIPDTSSEKIVESFSFLSFPMREMYEIRSNPVTNLADFPWHQLSVFGVDKNFLNTVYGEYLMVNSYDKSFKYNGIQDDPSLPDVIRSLYDDAGQAKLDIELGADLPSNVMSSVSIGYTEGETSIFYRNTNQSYTEYLDIIVSESLHYGLYAKIGQPLKMQVVSRYIEHYQVTVTYLMKIRAMVQKMSGFFFSSYRHFSFDSPLLLSMDQYQIILDNALALKREGYSGEGYSSEEIDDILKDFPSVPPKQRLFIRVKDGATLHQRESIMNGLRNFIADDTTVVFDTIDILETTDFATFTLLLFFDIIGIIAASLCFFVLWLSFTANIKENSWEFGVLRAVGLSANQVIRVYVYEALCIILSALFLGSITGLAIATTLTLQFNLFTEMPFRFDFPYILFFFVAAMSIVVAVAGSYLPANEIRKKQIAHVLKGSL